MQSAPTGRRSHRKRWMGVPAFRMRLSTAFAFAIGAAVGIYVETPFGDDSRPLPPGILLERILDQVDRNYVEQVDLDELVRAGLHRLVLQLDRNSAYIPPKDVVAFEGDTRGFYVGIGIVLDTPPTDGAAGAYPIILRLVEGGPAERAGLLPGDSMLAVDGRDLRGLALDELNKLLREQEGKELALLIRRGESPPQPVKVAISRVSYSSIGAVRLYTQDEFSVGYLRLQQFQDGTAADCRQALENLRKAGARSFILDLRENAGGILNEGVDLAALFLNDGLILTTKGRGAADERIYEVQAPGSFHSAPLALLLNGGSASASEVVAAALQDHRQAVLIGSPSYGKWTVQSVYSLGRDAEDGRLKLTTSSFHRPDAHRSQHDRDGHVRVIPDVEIPLDPGAERALAREWQGELLSHVDSPLAVVSHPIPAFTGSNEAPGAKVVDAPLIRALSILRDPKTYDRILDETEDRAKRGR